jgi:non-specific serine/threonine protein kinase
MATGTSYRTPGTLPPQTSGFVGREAELGHARELLRRSRLVTITGPGGVGKSRLAVRAAGEAADRFRDGAYVVELSVVHDPALLVHALVARLAIPEWSTAESDQGSQLDRLLGFIRDRQLLLILDTCEHLVDACAALADTVLREAPGVTILATSRQPLDAAGEAVLQLSPLPVPDPGAASAGKADAVELFAQRAAAAVPGFTVTPENLADVITVCRRLDGIPLAIELATVRLRALSLHQMAELIDDRLRLLTGGRRSGTPRHQTLRAAIEWSYSLCTPAEQLLWGRLSVFVGGFDLAAVEAVCAGGDLGSDEVVPTLISLVDKNVLTKESAPGQNPQDDGQPAEPRFRLLDTIREFGAERLHLAGTREITRRRDGLGERGRRPARAKEPARAEEPGASVGQAEAAVRRRFIAHYLTLAERFEREPTTDQLGQYQRLRREHANLRAAFDYALDLPGNDSAVVVLATSLFLYWRISGLLLEAEYWLGQALERCPRGSVVRARVLGTRGYVRVLLGDFANGHADAEAAVAMAATYGDLAAGGRAYSALHRALTFSGNLDEAQEAARSAVACLTSAGDTLGLAQLDAVDAMFRLQTGEPELCWENATRGLARLPPDELWCASYLYGLQSLGFLLLGDLERANPSGLQALEMKCRINDVIGMAIGLGGLGFVAAGEGRYERTAWLFGAAAPLWERAGQRYTGSPAHMALHQVAERAACGGLGDERFWALHAAGAAAPLDHVLERALKDHDRLDAPA